MARRSLPHPFRFQYPIFLVVSWVGLFVLSTNSSSSSSCQSIGRSLLQTNTPPPASNIQTPFFPSNSVPAFPGSLSPPPPPPPSPPPELSSPTAGGVGDQKNGSSNNSVTGAVLGTFFGTTVLLSLVFFAFYRYDTKRRQRRFSDFRENEKNKNPYSYNNDNNNGGRKNEGRGEGKQNMIVDDNGLDVLYWKNLEEGGGGLLLCNYCKQELNQNSDAEDNDEEGRRGHVLNKGRRRHRKQETPLIPSGFVRSDDLDPPRFGSHAASFVSSSIQSQPSGSLFPSPEPSRLFPPTAHSPSPPPTASGSATIWSTLPAQPEPLRTTSTSPPPIPSGTAISYNVPTTVKTSPPPPPLPIPAKSGAATPPQPPPLPVKHGATPPPPQPPPIPVKHVKHGVTPPPPPPPRAAPPPPPRPPNAGPNKAPPPVPPLPKGKPPPASRPPPPPQKAQLPPPAKLRPLHWDKMTTANVQHSMVWDKIPDGSFRFDDDDIMVTLFGTAATNRNSSESAHTRTGSGGGGGNTQQIVLLDPRKSQNIAIVLRSLAIGRQTILDALLDGHGLASDALEKLANAPRLTKDEEALILAFSDDPSKLADTESFFYHLLRSVPCPFERLDAMLFRTTFGHDVIQLKESLLVLETACKEMKNNAVFPKLLAAILKAGNRMNAGTSKGNAQAFNLTSLRRLSDVKSTDGKTTLLHFLVEEVVRSEGKRCVLNRTNSSTTTTTPSSTASREEKEREYMMLGLPVVGGLSIEFTNVKKAASIDYDTLLSSFSSLEAKLKKSKTSVLNAGEVGDFGKEMGEFLDTSEKELKLVGEEKERVTEFVARTTKYYVIGASKDRNFAPLQLFTIVKDFLMMVDQVCVDVARNIQQKQQKKRIEQKQQQQQQQASTAVGGTSDVISDRSSAGSGRLSSPTVSGRMSPVRFSNFPAHFLRKNSSDSDSDSDGDFDD